MPKLETPASKNHLLTTIVVIVAALVLIAFLYVLVMQVKHVSTLQGQMTNLQQNVENIAKRPEVPELFRDPAAFNKAVIAAFEGYVQAQQQEQITAKFDRYKAAVEKAPDDKHIYGPLDARFTLVEFSDFECPYCKRFHKTPKRIVDSSKGMVNWQWKHLPLDFHNPAAHVQAQASECVAELAGNRSFWVFLEDVFENSRGNGQGVTDLAALAQGVGVDAAAFNECMQSGRHEATVEDHVTQAEKFGINGTPATFIVDNHTGKSQLVSGAQPEQAFLAAMGKLANEKDSTAPQSGGD